MRSGRDVLVFLFCFFFLLGGISLSYAFDPIKPPEEMTLEELDALKVDQELRLRQMDRKPAVSFDYSASYYVEALDEFFLNAKTTGLVDVWVTEEGRDDRIERASQGQVIKVHSQFRSSKPEGNYIFYIRPDTGGYENALIFKGRHSGVNQISGTYASFYIPKVGQMDGVAKIYVYIPEHGVGFTTLNIISR